MAVIRLSRELCLVREGLGFAKRVLSALLSRIYGRANCDEAWSPALIGGEMQSPGPLQACLGQLAYRGPLLPLGRVVGFRDLFIKRKEVVNYPQPKHTHRQQI